jgi:plastocyanin
MRRTGTASALLAAVVLAGCGGGGGSGAAGGKAVTLKPGQPLRVSAREYGFDPKGVTIEARGRNVSVPIALHNSGVLGHDLIVERGGKQVGGTTVITGGNDASATVKLQPGSYTFFCDVGDHAQLGMKGTLTVR